MNMIPVPTGTCYAIRRHRARLAWSTGVSRLDNSGTRFVLLKVAGESCWVECRRLYLTRAAAMAAQRNDAQPARVAS